MCHSMPSSPREHLFFLFTATRPNEALSMSGIEGLGAQRKGSASDISLVNFPALESAWGSRALNPSRIGIRPVLHLSIIPSSRVLVQDLLQAPISSS
jgi:hypothetical protein